jgi:hypothetical protein
MAVAMQIRPVILPMQEEAEHFQQQYKPEP